jgi:hypothetical protein
MLTNKQKSMVSYIRGTRATAPAEVAEKHPELYDPWVANINVAAGDRCEYDGKVYECIQSHTTQADWTPDATPALWKRVYTEEWPQWVQPLGAHDAYDQGAKVQHKNAKWTSDIPANVYEPGVYGWTEFTE